MARNKRGYRSKDSGAKLKKAQKRMDNLMTSKSVNTKRILDKKPDEFHGARSGKKVKRIASKLLKDQGLTLKTVESLPSAPADGIYVIKPPHTIEKTLDKDHPLVYLVRAEEVILPAVQKAILEAWDRLQQCNITYNHTEDSNRTANLKPKTHTSASNPSTPALHCGVWSLSSNRPFITKDTRQRNSDARKCMETLLSLIKLHIAPVVKGILLSHSPNLWEKQKIAYDFVKQTVDDPFNQFECVDFGGAFFTVAIKEGSSNAVHIDFNDHLKSLTWLVPLGTWTGGDFLAPQLGVKVPVRAGQVLGAMTGQLAHAGSHISSGRRLVLTLFTDKTLVSQSQKK